MAFEFILTLPPPDMDFTVSLQLVGWLSDSSTVIQSGCPAGASDTWHHRSGASLYSVRPIISGLAWLLEVTMSSLFFSNTPCESQLTLTPLAVLHRNIHTGLPDFGTAD